MKTLQVDFNSRTMSGYIVLNSKEAVQSIKDAGGVKVGEIVTLNEGDIYVEAEIIRGYGGFYYADPNWETMEIVRDE